MKIDFVSDVVCPWCAIGMASLQMALKEVQPEIGEVELHIQPFELNPAMPPEGEEIVQHITRKYGTTPEQMAQTRERIAERGREVGFEFGPRERIVNTFDAHRLLHWASHDGPPGAAVRLKQALLQAYHGQGRSPADRQVLLDAAVQSGLDAAQAARVLDDRQAYAQEVRAAERHWTDLGIQGVPAVIIDDRYLISGGQAPQVYADALRQVAREMAQGQPQERTR